MEWLMIFQGSNERCGSELIPNNPRDSAEGPWHTRGDGATSPGPVVQTPLIVRGQLRRSSSKASAECPHAALPLPAVRGGWAWSLPTRRTGSPAAPPGGFRAAKCSSLAPAHGGRPPRGQESAVSSPSQPAQAVPRLPASPGAASSSGLSPGGQPVRLAAWKASFEEEKASLSQKVALTIVESSWTAGQPGLGKNSIVLRGWETTRGRTVRLSHFWIHSHGCWVPEKGHRSNHPGGEMTASWSGQDELQKIAGLIRVKSQGRGGRGGAGGGGSPESRGQERPAPLLRLVPRICEAEASLGPDCGGL